MCAYKVFRALWGGGENILIKKKKTKRELRSKRKSKSTIVVSLMQLTVKRLSRKISECV